MGCLVFSSFFFFNDTATTEIYTLSLHDALPISSLPPDCPQLLSAVRAAIKERTNVWMTVVTVPRRELRSEEHTSELQSPDHLVCRLLLEKKKTRERRRRCREDSSRTSPTRRRGI